MNISRERLRAMVQKIEMEARADERARIAGIVYTEFNDLLRSITTSFHESSPGFFKEDATPTKDLPQGAEYGIRVAKFKILDAIRNNGNQKEGTK